MIMGWNCLAISAHLNTLRMSKAMGNGSYVPSFKNILCGLLSFSCNFLFFLLLILLIKASFNFFFLFSDMVEIADCYTFTIGLQQAVIF